MLARVLVLGTVLLLAADTAEACSRLVGLIETAPRDGGRIPRNGVWFVAGYEVGTVEATWLDFDVFIPLRVERNMNVYEVSNDAHYFGREAIVSAESRGTNVDPIRREFRVVAFDDETPPIVGPIERAVARYFEAAPSECVEEGFTVEVTVARIEDDFELGAFYMFEASPDGAPLRQVSSFINEGGAVREPLGMSFQAGPAEGEGCYFVRAVDLGGNSTDTETVCLDLRRGAPDAGVVDAGSSADASARPRRGSEPVFTGRGCACRANDAPRGSPYTLLAFGLCVWVRRRTHQR